MGKKGKDKKKGKGAEKTNLKTEKKLALKQKKLIAKIGEADIEEIVAKFEADEASKKEVIETVCPAPSPRVNFTLTAHPDKEELIFFGGEFFDGQKTSIYNDLYFYNIPKNEWRIVKSPGGPTPRSGHQMVSVATDGGQLWLFGGEYASPSQVQFYHFKDLWVFRLNTKKWEKINAPNGPSARSGHRMVVNKKKLFVFGGFHDNNQTYRYFNDIYMFSLEDYQWQKIEAGGVNPPLPRSGCCMTATQDGKILIWGGYSKTLVKKEADKGTTHWDQFALVPDKNDTKGLTWKWVSVKFGGMKPPPRSGMSSALAANGKVYVFGGVMDTEEDEEHLQGQSSNDLHSLDIAGQVWRKIEYSVKQKDEKKSKKEKSTTDTEMKENAAEVKTVSDDGVFTMVVGSSSSTQTTPQNPEKESKSSSNEPSPRMNSGMVVCKGHLYLYGGLFEEGSRQYTLSDFYSLDIHKLNGWKTIISNNMASQEWLGSDSEDSCGEDGSEDDEDADDTDDEDSDSEMETD